MDNQAQKGCTTNMKSRILLLCLCLMLLAWTQSLAQGSEKVLRVYGKGAAGDLDNTLFSSKVPDVVIDGSDELEISNPKELITVLLTKDAYDLYAVYAPYCDFTEISRRGYAMDLADDAGIASSVGQMYGFVRDAVCMEGQILGIPLSVDCTQWGYAPEVWEKIREAYDRELPADYLSLFQFFEWWIDKGQYVFPEIGLVRTDENVKKVVTQLLTEQILDIDWHEKGTGLASDGMTEQVFRQLEKVDFDRLNYQTVLEEGDEQPFVFDPFCEWTQLQEDDGESWRPLLLRLNGEKTSFIPVDIRVMFVNPATQMKEKAILYLSTFLEREDPLASILLQEGEHEPIANQKVMDDLSVLESQISQLKEMNTDTAAETAERLEREKTILQKRIWNVTEERIRDYQQMTAYFFPRRFNPVYMSDTSENSYYFQILNSFVRGETDSAGFLSELQRMENMMIAEGQ